MTTGGVTISKVEKFHYLRSIIQEGGDINKDINHHIKVGWQKMEEYFMSVV